MDAKEIIGKVVHVDVIADPEHWRKLVYASVPRAGTQKPKILKRWIPLYSLVEDEDKALKVVLRELEAEAQPLLDAIELERRILRSIPATQDSRQTSK
jgi:hypothetical protein